MIEDNIPDEEFQTEIPDDFLTAEAENARNGKRLVWLLASLLGGVIVACLLIKLF